MRRLLVTGASGILGRNLARMAIQQDWDVYGTYFTNPPPLLGQWLQVDVGDRGAVVDMVRQIQPTAVVHTAFRQHREAMWATTAEAAAFVDSCATPFGTTILVTQYQKRKFDPQSRFKRQSDILLRQRRLRVLGGV